MLKTVKIMLDKFLKIDGKGKYKSLKVFFTIGEVVWNKNYFILYVSYKNKKKILNKIFVFIKILLRRIVKNKTHFLSKRKEYSQYIEKSIFILSKISYIIYALLKKYIIKNIFFLSRFFYGIKPLMIRNKVTKTAYNFEYILVIWYKPFFYIKKKILHKIRFMFLKILETGTSSKQLAIAISFGSWIGLTFIPAPGHLILATIIAGIFRLNFIAVFLGSWMTTIMIIPYFFAYKLGALITGYEYRIITINSKHIFQSIQSIDSTLLIYSFNDYLVWLIGCIVSGAIIAIPIYFISYYLIKKYRKRPSFTIKTINKEEKEDIPREIKQFSIILQGIKKKNEKNKIKKYNVKKTELVEEIAGDSKNIIKTKLSQKRGRIPYTIIREEQDNNIDISIKSIQANKQVFIHENKIAFKQNNVQDKLKNNYQDSIKEQEYTNYASFETSYIMYTYKKIGSRIIRVGDPFKPIFFIKTSIGMIRTGSLPDLVKLTEFKKIKDDYVIVCPPSNDMSGCSWLGEEFILWNIVVNKRKEKRIYIGSKTNIDLLYNKLKLNINQSFDDSKLKTIKVNRLDEIFEKLYTRESSGFSYKQIGTVEVYIHSRANRIVILEKGHVIFDSSKYIKKKYIEKLEKKIIMNLTRHKTRLIYQNFLSVIVVGSGNGFTGISASFIVKYGNKRIFIDPPARFDIELQKLKLNIFDISDFLITHCHEDHSGGFPQLIAFFMAHQRRVNIITTAPIFKRLIEIYSFSIKNIERYVSLSEIIPDNPVKLDGVTINSRLNHHVLSEGTLGIRFNFQGKELSISGDTKYSEKINEKLNRPDLTSEWFSKTKLLFHEVSFKENSHTYFRDLEHLRDKIKAKLLIYHCGSGNNIFEKAKEGYEYILKDEISEKRIY